LDGIAARTIIATDHSVINSVNDVLDLKCAETRSDRASIGPQLNCLQSVDGANPLFACASSAPRLAFDGRTKTVTREVRRKYSPLRRNLIHRRSLSEHWSHNSRTAARQSRSLDLATDERDSSRLLFRRGGGRWR
jgi:hypothetical protein